MNDTSTPSLQTSASADATIQAIHGVSDALPHQYPPSPLGILGKMPLEVRNQIYRDIFVQSEVFLKSQCFSPLSDSPGQVLVVSKALRFEALPQFYQHCQFSFTMRFSPEHEVINPPPALQQQVSSMRRVNLNTYMAEFQTDDTSARFQRIGVLPMEVHFVDDFRHVDTFARLKRIAVLPMVLHSGKGFRQVRVSNLFDKTRGNDQQITLNVTGIAKGHIRYWSPSDTSVLVEVLRIFRGLHTVRFRLKIGNPANAWETIRDECRNFSKLLQEEVVAALGPGVHVEEEEEEEKDEGFDLQFIVYRPKLYPDAEGVGPEERY